MKQSRLKNLVKTSLHDTVPDIIMSQLILIQDFDSSQSPFVQYRMHREQ